MHHENREHIRIQKNIKKYTDLAEKERVIVHRNKGKSFALVPVDEVDETTYLPATEANRKNLEEASKKSRKARGKNRGSVKINIK